MRHVPAVTPRHRFTSTPDVHAGEPLFRTDGKAPPMGTRQPHTPLFTSALSAGGLSLPAAPAHAVSGHRRGHRRGTGDGAHVGPARRHRPSGRRHVQRERQHHRGRQVRLPHHPDRFVSSRAQSGRRLRAPPRRSLVRDGLGRQKAERPAPPRGSGPLVSRSAAVDRSVSSGRRPASRAGRQAPRPTPGRRSCRPTPRSTNRRRHPRAHRPERRRHPRQRRPRRPRGT